MKKSAWIALSALMIATAGLSAKPAKASFDLGVLANLSMMNISQTPAPTTPYSSKMGIGFGGIASFGLMPGLNLDAGLIYAGRKIEQTGSTYGMNYLEIPVIARYTILPMINLGAGIYYGMAMGDISDSAGTNITYAAANLATSDMGMILSAGARIPAPGFGIILNLNYLMGLKDLTTPAVAGQSSKWGGLEIQAGASFGM